MEHEIINDYLKNLRTKELCNKYRISKYSLNKILKTNNIPLRKSNIKNLFNYEYFNKIDTETKAYFLGLLYADGNVISKINRVSISLAKEDSYILEKFKNQIEFKGNLLQVQINRRFENRQDQVKLQMHSKNLCQDLHKLGMVDKKSLILTFPTNEQVPENLLHHFIRRI